MARNYINIEKTIAETGFFSEYLPPCFSLDKRALNRVPEEKCDLIPPYAFTMSRYNNNNARRTIFIPEIGSYNVARNYIRQENILQELIEFTESSCSSFSPILGKDDSVVKHEQSYGGSITNDEDGALSNYIQNLSKKIIRARGAKYVLKLDISNFYSSFYLHMIPAILLGYENADIDYKKSIIKKDDPTISVIYKKYQKLDIIIRAQNLNRTNGLLTGPIVSKIIAESLLTRIDKELSDNGLNFSRYMDDYEVYLYDENEKAIINLFTSVLKKYGFTLNNEKTEKELFPYYVLKDLEKHIESFKVIELDTASIMELFNVFFDYEQNGTKGAIRYLLKYIEKNPLNIKNIDLYKSYLITILSNNERSLSKSCLLLIKNNKGLKFEDKDIEIIINLLDKNIRNNNDLEVIWLLYLLLKLNKLKRTNNLIDRIINSKNELAILMLLSSGLLNNTRINKALENASSWILLYELFLRNKITEAELITKLALNKNKSVYIKLKDDNIHFCRMDL